MYFWEFLFEILWLPIIPMSIYSTPYHVIPLNFVLYFFCRRKFRWEVWGILADIPYILSDIPTKYHAHDWFYVFFVNMSHHASMGRPDAVLETILPVNQTYVLVENIGNRQ